MLPDFNLIIAGGRDFADYESLVRIATKAISSKLLTHKVNIVCGMARGTDLLGKKIAEEFGYDVIECPADWENLGKSAGYIRNKYMASISHALLAFYDGTSKGTGHMIDLANEFNLKIRVIKYTTP